MSVNALEEENKALRTKVAALENELKQRNAEAVKLRNEMQQLASVKQKNESQQETILALRSELDFARAAHTSALEALEKARKDNRAAEHRERVERLQARLADEEPHPQAPPGTATQKTATAGGIVMTSSGPQVVCNSSDISSLGFGRVQRPVDFLGGAQNALHRTGNTAHAKEGEESEVERLMAMARDGAMMDIQYADVDDHEEKKLRERLEALRRR
ncbi:hypothetical protein DQ04_07011030 [Trypanosoma grayi]|uniref:hypothetical protein n=1 Tax=Trypanosoma grayi TaxID=71804 RepID=UPI0004F43C52|nr:hypothetical protein DQ04_07011030 [Trypanosoma grayi]KEG08512.1 hypothetical protein DQ04_07011030 [Trypanosoma grayi]